MSIEPRRPDQITKVWYAAGRLARQLSLIAAVAISAAAPVANAGSVVSTAQTTYAERLSPGSVSIGAGSVHIQTGEAAVDLQAAVRLDNVWLEIDPAQCRGTESYADCQLAAGTLHLSHDGEATRLSFTAAKSTVLQGLRLSGSLLLPGARGWLSNGFQSWSQTGVISLAPVPSAEATATAAAKTGEDEVYRRGRELSWWYTFAGGGDNAFVAGAATANTFKSWVQLGTQPQPWPLSRPRSTASGDNANISQPLVVQLVSGAGESIAMTAGQTVAGEDWYLYLGPSAGLQSAFAAYGAQLGSRHTQKRVAPLVGWNSWYDLWQGVTEEDIKANAADYVATKIPSLAASKGPGWIVLDDGWEQRWGDWYTNDKFPSGLSGTAALVAAHGLRLGLWLAPLLVAPDSDTAKAHPDWLVKGVTYVHPSGIYRVLDVTNPDAAGHLQATIHRLVGAGIGLLKIDFLFSGSLEGGRYEQMTGMQAYALAMQLIRDAAGESTVLMAVGAPPLTTLSYVDGWRVGGDIAFSPAIFGIPAPGFSFIANQARSLAGRQPFCLVTLCDADPMLLRWPLSEAAAHTGMWIAAATGSALFLSDNLPTLAPDRLKWAEAPAFLQAGLSGTAAQPLSYFPEKIPADLVNMKDDLFNAEHAVPSLWHFPGGTDVAINFTWSDAVIGGTKVPSHATAVLGSHL